MLPTLTKMNSLLRDLIHIHLNIFKLTYATENSQIKSAWLDQKHLPVLILF